MKDSFNNFYYTINAYLHLLTNVTFIYTPTEQMLYLSILILLV